MEISVRDSVWYVDLGASFNIVENKDFFNILEKKDMQFHINIGDDGRYMTKGVGKVRFKRKFSSLLHLKNVMYVLRLKKNLISVVVLEDKGHVVILKKGKAYLKHFASG